MRKVEKIPEFSLFGEVGFFPDVVHCEKVVDRAKGNEWVISPHRHAQMVQVFYIRTGAARVGIDGRRVSLEKEKFLYVPTGVAHEFTFNRDTDGFVLSLPLTTVNNMGPKHHKLSGWLNQIHLGSVSSAVSDLFDEMTTQHNSSGTFRAQKLVALAHLILVSLAEESRRLPNLVGERHQQMDQLAQILTQNPSRDRSMADLASMMNMTSGNLNRVVRAETGMTLSAYIETKIMTEACRQLAFTRMSVSEVGFSLGYTDPPYFSRRFRKRIGVTPTEYRTHFVNEG